MEGDNTKTERKIKSWLGGHGGWLRLGAKILLLVAIFFVFFGVCFGLHRVNDPSMSQRLEDGDLVLYSKMIDEYKVGDVVIFEHEGQTYTSAIIAESGDLLEIDENGRLHLNGTQISDDVIITPEQKNELSMSPQFRVPTDSFFVLNENLESIKDSRSFGAINKRDMKGKVVGVLRTRSI